MMAWRRSRVSARWASVPIPGAAIRAAAHCAAVIADSAVDVVRPDRADEMSSTMGTGLCHFARTVVLISITREAR
jgi:hypothetical protein